MHSDLTFLAKQCCQGLFARGLRLPEGAHWRVDCADVELVVVLLLALQPPDLDLLWKQPHVRVEQQLELHIWRSFKGTGTKQVHNVSRQQAPAVKLAPQRSPCDRPRAFEWAPRGPQMIWAVQVG